MVRVTRLREPQPKIALNRRPRRTRPSLDGRRDRIPIQTLDKSFGIMQISRLKALCESAVNRPIVSGPLYSALVLAKVAQDHRTFAVPSKALVACGRSPSSR